MCGLEFVGIAGRNGRWYGIILSGLDCNEMIEIQECFHIAGENVEGFSTTISRDHQEVQILEISYALNKQCLGSPSMAMDGDL